MARRRISEAETRKELIDPQLERAGWYLRDHSKVKIEIPVDGYDKEPWNGVSDYCLYRENGEVLAVVEAKRTSTDVRLAEAQLTHYVTEIEKRQSFRPFGFLANGLEIYFVDVGHAPKREVFGFFTREDLENLLYIRQNAKPLGSVEINNEIVDRAYQHEAIRRVCEAFEIPSQRFTARPYALPFNVRDVVLAGVVAQACPEHSRRVESLRGRMVESERQVENLFDSMLSESFGGW
jgi:type I site-specific restriction endonuclease